MTSLAGRRVAIANRAEIAVRVAATCRRLGMIPIVLLEEPERTGYAARQIGRAEIIGPIGSLFEVERVIAGAERVRADFLHPGYGFLSERADLAAACRGAGITFVGPSAETLRLCGDKLATREAAVAAGVPILPASGPLGDDPDEWPRSASTTGYPLLVKPAGAGGGRGLRRVESEADLVTAIQTSRREAAASGAGDAVYLERELSAPRHIEVQVAGDGRSVIALGDRDCSLQRRHQKVIEEAPAPFLPDDLRESLHDHACRAAAAVGLTGIATCEFLVAADTLAFLEINPRIQVEHPVTEIVTGIDLIEWQFRIAAGQGLPLSAAPSPRGHAIEARIYAEDPAAGFLPAQGRLAVVAWPDRPDLRVDAGYAGGDTVPAAYDPMLAKVIAWGFDRDAAVASLDDALRETTVAGLPTNIPWLRAALAEGEVRGGRTTTLTASQIELPPPDRTVALAAATGSILDRPKASDAWHAAGPFRLIGTAPLTFHGDDWEMRVALSRTGNRWNVEIDGDSRPLAWHRDDAGAWTIVYGDNVARVAVVQHPDCIEVSGGGSRWLLRLGPKRTEHRNQQKAAGDGMVLAPLTGRVLHVDVVIGDRVTEGQSLVALEAMKIELACSAPANGTVVAIHCQPGEIVETGALLIALHHDSASDTPSS